MEVRDPRGIIVNEPLVYEMMSVPVSENFLSLKVVDPP
jgi:hypothetical protein